MINDQELSTSFAKRLWKAAALIKRLGSDYRLTVLLGELTFDCPRRGQQAMLDQCGAAFLDLKA